jgi:hypothetical protein
LVGGTDYQLGVNQSKLNHYTASKLKLAQHLFPAPRTICDSFVAVLPPLHTLAAKVSSAMGEVGRAARAKGTHRPCEVPFWLLVEAEVSLWFSATSPRALAAPKKPPFPRFPPVVMRCCFDCLRNLAFTESIGPGAIVSVFDS